MKITMPKRIIYLSRFAKNPRGNGGEKRVAQLCDALTPLDYEFVTLVNVALPHKEKLKKIFCKPSGCFRKLFSNSVKQYITYRKYFKWSEEFRDRIVNLHIISKIFTNTLLNNKPDLIIIDDPVFLTPVCTLCKKQ